VSAKPDQASDRMFRLLAIEIGGVTSFAIIGALLGIVAGILVAREYGFREGGNLKDGGDLMQHVAHRTSRTSIPVGASIGAILGAMAGYLFNRVVEERRRAREGLGTATEGDKHEPRRKPVSPIWMFLVGITILIGVIAWASLQPSVPSALPPGPSDIERRFSLIQVGMTDDEVQSIFGRREDGSNQDSVVSSVKYKYLYYWTAREGGRSLKVEVFFDEDVRVVYKELQVRAQKDW
jgi:hypothetical protein